MSKTTARGRRLLPLVIAVLLFASPVSAIELYGFGSYWNQRDADGSWGTGLGVDLPLFIELLRIDGRLYFFEDSDYGRDDSLTLTPFDLGLQVHLLPDFDTDPYLLGGISYIFADADRSDVDSGFGGYLGAGVNIDLGMPFFNLFGEGIYRFSNLDTALGDDLDVGGFSANVGIKFHF